MGGEIRDEGAVGRGSKPKAGLCGFTVSDLLLPDFRQPWELDEGKPGHIASSLDIMLEAPLGSAAFNNEFGRPCTTGYFRTFLAKVPTAGGGTELRGYHKPIMIAGGVGTVRPQHALKDPEMVPVGAHLIIIGGPVSRFLNISCPFLSVSRSLSYVSAVSACKAWTSLVALTERSNADRNLLRQC